MSRIIMQCMYMYTNIHNLVIEGLGWGERERNRQTERGEGE